ncbi:hypothetical protein FG167_14320 [Lacinutrix sp. WUR7]|uniref:hypothetical protein n=1 Tax=Lacinutrix sp. WUR7 TaxID=2653681 RepID=UPI00193DB31B|nr:hypothetical protein [Lacinutrix sp. WUR7]QRM90362.1 hypothetical protein FG167_14320 [Lacinutrix sp. WUR7]
MKNLKKLLFVSLFFILNACFNHADDITIYRSGKIELVSTIEISDKEADKDQVNEEIEKKIAQLKKEGWYVSYKWKKKSKPYKIIFTASNNIDKIHEYQVETEGDTPSGIYIYKKFSDKQYVVTFDLLSDANNRILNLSRNSLPLYRVNDDGKLEFTRNIKSEKKYYVVLD